MEEIMYIPLWVVWTVLVFSLLLYVGLVILCNHYNFKWWEVSEMKYIQDERKAKVIRIYKQKLRSSFIIRSIVAGIVAIFFYGLSKPLLFFAVLFCLIIAVCDLYRYFELKDSIS